MSKMLQSAMLCLSLILLMLAPVGCTHLEPRGSDQRFIDRSKEQLGAWEMYEISLDFWEAMDRVKSQNHLRFFETLRDFGWAVEEHHKERLSRLINAYQQENSYLAELRRRTDPNKDRLFYYGGRSTEGVVIVRKGSIRDKLVLHGEGMWTGE